ncbi:cyclic nucleotide-binding domain-containing protein [Catenulispora sp. NF23]|uniref:Cyclic nucleotide-binding domain-containing protein n=1 Tax=Catenulispora pinistramenti TaxID=2705254 RepID=A0ABS5KKR8_9ACTN|nr:family 2B encapsulin nanocompartment shell protein [Catenulispora pinistramenti]MBS2531173.1 cyclic nucleotide-binding domain-containing protein [Catenulispora pinistramenti]MBS2546630.1 cyclic nucleotide-binding domain-containing protein [Catenulispora pinistramenti]
MPETTNAPDSEQAQQAQLSLSTEAARNLATTTKSVPQMQGITSRWLLKLLPWTQVSGGTYRVNRRLAYQVGDGRVAFDKTGADVKVVPETLVELPLLRGFADTEVLTALAASFVQREYAAGDTIVAAGAPVEETYLIAHGKADMIGTGKYGNEAVFDTLADGDQFGGQYVVPGAEHTWGFTVAARTALTALALPLSAVAALGDRAAPLLAHIQQAAEDPQPAQNKHGEAEIGMSAGHAGEEILPGTFVDYELTPREYELSIAQTVLRIHSRVADLYSEPMDQTQQQLRLTVEALRERQESELVNNRSFGLLHNADLRQCFSTRTGPPTPDDLDELLSRRRKTHFILAHPKAIAAFGRECTHRGIYPSAVDVDGHMIPSWRGVPILPCNKIPVGDGRSTSILAVRTGEADQGVIGLHQTGIPDEVEPSLSARFMGISDKAIISYLVTAYFSVAVLVPDALGILENVELGHYHN